MHFLKVSVVASNLSINFCVEVLNNRTAAIVQPLRMTDVPIKECHVFHSIVTCLIAKGTACDSFPLYSTAF